MEGHLAGAVGEVSDSWFWLRPRPWGSEIKPRVGLHARYSLLGILSLSAPPVCAFSLSGANNKSSTNMEVAVVKIEKY